MVLQGSFRRTAATVRAPPGSPEAHGGEAGDPQRCEQDTKMTRQDEQHD